MWFCQVRLAGTISLQDEARSVINNCAQVHWRTEERQKRKVGEKNDYWLFFHLSIDPMDADGPEARVVGPTSPESEATVVDATTFPYLVLPCGTILSVPRSVRLTVPHHL